MLIIIIIGIALMYSTLHFSGCRYEFVNNAKQRKKNMIIREGSENSLPFVNDADLYTCVCILMSGPIHCTTENRMTDDKDK